MVPITNSPASLPYVVGVGSTVLYTDCAGHRSREYGWAFSVGGSTFFVPAPSYQLGTPGLVPCLDNPLTTCRGISDVAAQFGDVVGMSSTDTATGLPASNGLYATTPGWDYVTGFGTPRVAGLSQWLALRA